MSDFEPPTACWVTSPTARKQHRCGECRQTIEPGETYERVAGVWSSEFDHHKTCSACLRLRDWLGEQNCDWFFGGVYECFHDSGLDEEIEPLVLIGMQSLG